MTDWHYVVDGKAQGPVSDQQLRALLTEGSLNADTMVWTEGMPKWQKLRETRQFAPSDTASPGGDTGQSSRGGPERGADLRYNMKLTLEEVFQGKTAEIEIPIPVTCEECSGTGAKPGTKPKSCASCGGTGRIPQSPGSPEHPCPACQGRSQMIEQNCTACSGQGRVTRARRFSVPIPPGIKDGTRIRLRGAGEAGIRGGPAGDLYLFLSVAQRGGATTTNPVAGDVAAINLRVGEVLHQSLKTLWARIGIWLLLGLAHFALTLPFIMALTSVPSLSSRYMVMLVPLAIAIPVQPIIIFGAFQTLHGQHFHLGEVVQRGFERFLPVLAITCLSILMVIGSLFIARLRDNFVGKGFDYGSYIFATILVGPFIAAKTFVAIPACVVDALPFNVSLSLSFRLTRNRHHFWKVFALVLLAIAPFVLVAVFATLYLAPSLRLALSGSAIEMGGVAELILMPLHWLPFAFFPIVAATTYARLKAPSSLPTDKIAEVFD